MHETIDHDHAHLSLEEKRIAAELTSITLSKNPEWDARAEWTDQADYTGKLFARILRYVREELTDDDEEDLDDEDEDDEDDEEEESEAGPLRR